jgi:hypothetical protein
LSGDGPESISGTLANDAFDGLEKMYTFFHKGLKVSPNRKCLYIREPNEQIPDTRGIYYNAYNNNVSYRSFHPGLEYMRKIYCYKWPMNLDRNDWSVMCRDQRDSFVVTCSNFIPETYGDSEEVDEKVNFYSYADIYEHKEVIYQDIKTNDVMRAPSYVINVLPHTDFYDTPRVILANQMINSRPNDRAAYSIYRKDLLSSDSSDADKNKYWVTKPHIGHGTAMNSQNALAERTQKYIMAYDKGVIQGKIGGGTMSKHLSAWLALVVGNKENPTVPNNDGRDRQQRKQLAQAYFEFLLGPKKYTETLDKMRKARDSR